jgi:hypothetical protein
MSFVFLDFPSSTGIDVVLRTDNWGSYLTSFSDMPSQRSGGS